MANKTRYFTRMHPVPALIYFIAAILVTALNVTPVTAGLSLVFSLAFGFFINGKKFGGLSVLFFIPFAAVFSAVNALFVRDGVTRLFTVFKLNVTLEALLYGLNSAATAYAILMWCGGLSAVITTEKTTLVFGKIAPKTAVVLSMTFGFVPKTAKRFKDIFDAQKGIGAYLGGGFKKTKAKLNAVLSLITAQLESSVAVADSMRARGYGLKKRTNADFNKFRAGDALPCVLFSALGIAAAAFSVTSAGEFSFYPEISPLSFNGNTAVYYALSAALFALPAILEIKDDLKWNYLKSKI